MVYSAPRQPPRAASAFSNRRGGSTPTTPLDVRDNAAPSTPTPVGPAPHGPPIFNHPGAVAAWRLSSQGAGELLSVAEVGPEGHGAGGDPRRRLTTPVVASPSVRALDTPSGQQIRAACAPLWEQLDCGAACAANLDMPDAHSSGSGEAVPARVRRAAAGAMTFVESPAMLPPLQLAAANLLGAAQSDCVCPRRRHRRPPGPRRRPESPGGAADAAVPDARLQPLPEPRVGRGPAAHLCVCQTGHRRLR